MLTLGPAEGREVLKTQWRGDESRDGSCVTGDGRDGRLGIDGDGWLIGDGVG